MQPVAIACIYDQLSYDKPNIISGYFNTYILLLGGTSLGLYILVHTYHIPDII